MPIDNDTQVSKSFSIRLANGKYGEFDNASDLADFYNKYSGKPIRKKKRKTSAKRKAEKLIRRKRGNARILGVSEEELTKKTDN